MEKVKSLRLQNRLQQLKNRYELSDLDLEILEKVQQYQIKSICCTTEGGFDKKTGAFYTEDRTLNYKIKIAYKRNDSAPTEFVLIKAEEAEEEDLFQFPQKTTHLEKAV
ncbi:hypothetical protein SAMN04487907_1011107 [Zunongwangia mangrovi]|uniref:Uncharacterized protein n=1 Tax=Zunongwangia mangrovi TaxID=1334022 RepID=A0A1I1ETA4_9FLAO|nr:hypothetical protein [Zunongwangia mangrovi]SFB90237.1 hypothetical protein SAMN04487907_1011107 [Zunongwangia mangrovi]